jgi:threonine/homoserine/homoserine lactone efflux protein
VIAFLIQGIVLGLSAGVSPGPLTTLVIAETLQHKTRAGIKVAIAPLITDMPIVLLCFFLLTRFSNVPILLGIISILGGLYILRLGIKSLRIKDFKVDVSSVKSQSIVRGVVTNFLSPNPYMFWITVGSSIMIKALEISSMTLVLFLAGFYICLVGTKILMAVLVGLSRQFLTGRLFVVLNKILGAALILFACLLWYEGVKYFMP